MKINKQYRFEENPQEKIFHDKFIEMFDRNGFANKTLSAIIFGWKDDCQSVPAKYLTDEEENVCLNLIQWLGTPVGQSFLNECGFVLKENKYI